MQKMDEMTEKKILQALESAVESVNLGATPNDAIYKVASDSGFGPPIVQRMVEAFNTSKTLSWLKQADIEKRAEAFELADAAKILERMYPEAPKTPAEQVKSSTAIKERDEDRNYTLKSSGVLPERTAVAPYPTETNFDYTRWSAKSARLNREIDEAKIEFLKAKEGVIANVKSAVSYFRTLGHEPFAEVEKRALAEYGDVGKVCMDLVFEMGKLNEKRASVPSQKFVFDLSRRPYAQISAAIVQSKQAAHWSSKLSKLEKDADDHAQAFSAFLPEKATILGEVLADGKPFPGQSQSYPLADVLGKEAFDLSSAIMGTLGGLGLSSEPDAKKYETKAVEQLRDPVHEAEMSSARVRTMLNDFLANDEVLSGYPEDSVLTSYNQLANLAPTAAQQPAIMRSLLRRMVQQGGVIEPFEAKQLSEIENTITKRERSGEDAK